MTTLDILKQARELISDEGRWTQGVGARNQSGMPVFPGGSSASCWCAFGALHRALTEDNVDAFRSAVNALGDAAGESIVDFNDNHTHAEVLAAFDAAIAKLEGETA